MRCDECGRKDCCGAHMQARIDELTAGYTEAIYDIADWGAYASEYFQQKHDLEGCIKAHEELLEAEK